MYVYLNDQDPVLKCNEFDSVTLGCPQSPDPRRY